MLGCAPPFLQSTSCYLCHLLAPALWPSFISSNTPSSFPPWLPYTCCSLHLKTLPSALCIMGFFSCLGPELKCHLLRGGLPDPDHCSLQVLPLVLFPLHPPFLFLTLSTIYTFFFLYPSFMCAPSGRIQALLRESIVSVFSTPMFVMFVPHCLAHRRCLIIEIEWSLA